MDIERGDLVDATTASGSTVRMRALGGVVQGHDFPVVWVCTEEEWERSLGANESADGIPWPIDAVHQLAAT
jgi:hypothetical protein